MLENAWHYALALYRTDGTAVGQAPVDVDWGPAEQWVRLLALRRGVALRNGAGSIRPLRRRNDLPALRGFRVCLHGENGHAPICCEFPIAYFKRVAREVGNALSAAGRMNSGEKFLFLPLAYRRVPADPVVPRPRFRVADATVLPVLQERGLPAPGLAEADLGETSALDLPVFVPRGVLDEIALLTRRAAAVETGGVLVGHLCRDSVRREIFGRVTAQVPAQHAASTATSLSFAAETWAELRGSIDTRGRDELMLGWWHSHPVRYWGQCDVSARAEHERCGLAASCFSEQDEALHRVVFPGAHTIALVANDVSDASVSFAVYGWRLGILQRRGLHVVTDAA